MLPLNRLILSCLATMICGQLTNIKEKMAVKFKNIVSAFDTFFEDSVNACQLMANHSLPEIFVGNLKIFQFFWEIACSQDYISMGRRSGRVNFFSCGENFLWQKRLK